MLLKELTNNVLEAFSKRNQKRMRQVNDQILEALLSSFSVEMFRLAVISYVLSKILAKPRFYGRAYKEGRDRLEQVLQHMVRVSESREKYLTALDNLEETVREMESEDPRFVKSLMEKGRLKTAAILYAQGISLSLASELTGVPKQDIMDYSGKTMMADKVMDTVSMRERIKSAKKIFG